MVDPANCDHLVAVDAAQEYGQESLVWTRQSRMNDPLVRANMGANDLVDARTGTDVSDGPGLLAANFNFCPVCGTKLELPK